MEDVIVVGGGRRLTTDREFLWQRLMFTKSLETSPLLETSRRR